MAALLLAGLVFGLALQEVESDADREELALLEQEIQRGRFRAARRDLIDYLGDFSNSVQARLLLARLESRQGETDESRRWLDEARAIASDGPDLPLWAEEAFDLEFSVGRWEVAAAALDAGLGVESRRAGLLSRRVVLAAHTGDIDAARLALRSLPAATASPAGRPGTHAGTGSLPGWRCTTWNPRRASPPMPRSCGRTAVTHARPRRWSSWARPIATRGKRTASWPSAPSRTR